MVGHTLWELEGKRTKGVEMGVTVSLVILPPLERTVFGIKYRGRPLSVGNTIQDPQWVPGTVSST